MRRDPRRARLLVVGFVIAATAVGLGVLLREPAANPPPELDREAKTRDEQRAGRSDRTNGARRPRRELPDVPHLIGLTPAEVRQRVDPLGIETHFSAHCPGRPPEGVVIRQYPAAGRRPDVSYHQRIPSVSLTTNVSSACSDRRADSPCAPEQLRLKADGYQAGFPGSGGRFVESFDLRNTSKTSCQLIEDATMTLTSREGASPDAIVGHPATVRLDLRLPPKETFTWTWTFDNWCELHGGWRLAVAVGPLIAIGNSGSPVCFERKQPPIIYPGGS